MAIFIENITVFYQFLTWGFLHLFSPHGHLSAQYICPLFTGISRFLSVGTRCLLQNPKGRKFAKNQAHFRMRPTYLSYQFHPSMSIIFCAESCISALCIISFCFICTIFHLVFLKLLCYLIDTRKNTSKKKCSEGPENINWAKDL